MRRAIGLLTGILLVSGSFVVVGSHLRADDDPNAPDATVVKLRELSASDIESVQLFRLSRNANPPEREFVRPELEEDEIRGLLSLIKGARPIGPAGEREMAHPADRVAVFTLRDGRTLQVTYNASLKAPFGRLESLPLKNALHALTARSRGCMIHLADGAVEEVVAFDAPPAGVGSTRTSDWSAGLRLTERGDVMVGLKIRRDGKALVEGSRPMQYGGAAVYRYDGRRTMVVHLYLP